MEASLLFSGGASFGGPAAFLETQPAMPAAAAQPAKAVANRAYFLARLERDFPALAARIEIGELSVYRASIEAGLRKRPARNWTKPEAYQPGEQKPAPKKTADQAAAL